MSQASARRTAALVVLLLVARRADGQDSVQHRACRDPHPAPVCGSYLLFEYMGGVRMGGTQVTTPVETKPALGSWFAWDVGWMKNASRSRSLGASLGIGGSEDGTRVTLKARHRQWLAHDLVVDASAGPMVTALQNGGVEGQTATRGATADVGFGRARLGLVTLSADVARQRGRMQFAAHAGGRIESRGAVVFSGVALLAVVVAASAGGGIGGGFSFY